MSEVIFTFEPSNAQVRVVQVGDAPWFVAADVCRALDMRAAGRQRRRWTGNIPAAEKGHQAVDTPWSLMVPDPE